MQPKTAMTGPETISETLNASADRVQQAPGDAMARRFESEVLRDEPTEAQIRARAYQMYLERGARDGLDFDDWLRAERELKTGR